MVIFKKKKVAEASRIAGAGGTLMKNPGLNNKGIIR